MAGNITGSLIGLKKPFNSKEDNIMAQPFFNTNYRVASTAPAAALIAKPGKPKGKCLPTWVSRLAV